MNYTAQHIALILKSKAALLAFPDMAISHIIFDSRNVDFPEESIFFAFESARNDGHQFIEQLYQKGVRNFVIQKPINHSTYPEANFFKLADTRSALQQLAFHHRRQFDLPVIGITGSNGKTIIKEWLFHCLKDKFQTVRSPKSFNSQIGVPLSVLQINKEHNLGIFEAGISTTGEMNKLNPIINCTLGIFSNIGQAHDEGFENHEEKINEKLCLFKNCDTLIYCKDAQLIQQCILKTYPQKRTFTWSHHENADLQIQNLFQTQPGKTQIEAIYKQTSIAIEIPFTSKAAIENAIHCWATLLLLDCKTALIEAKMSTLPSIDMRLELRAGINNSILINDSYSADLTSLSIALNFMEQHAGTLDRTLILSDIFQSGQDMDELYKSVASLLKEKKIKTIIGIGKSIPFLKNKSTIPQQFFFKTTEQFLKVFDLDFFQQQIILVKGARIFQLEKIAELLAQKKHNTRLEIDLSAITHNYKVFKNAINPATKLMVMVKAAAYGSGSAEIARLLEFQHVDYLAVAYADEGVDLRKAGITTPIMVLNPEKATFDALIRYDLEPEIYSLSLLEQFIDFLPKQKKVRLHIKIDTGMHRLGFEAIDIEALANRLTQFPQIKVGSIFSHLAASDEKSQDEFTHKQYELFEALSDQLISYIGYKPLRHILNSSGIIRFPQYQMDMVRLGIGLYGIDSNNILTQKLVTALSLKASISQIKSVQKGKTIGYSRKGKAIKNMRVGTISIGYADGLLRSAGNNRYEVLIKNKKAPIIGNVCMDMTMVDLSHIPNAKTGDEVLIFGKELPVQNLANVYDSLVYEVFTGISERVQRVYYTE